MEMVLEASTIITYVETHDHNPFKPMSIPNIELQSESTTIVSNIHHSMNIALTRLDSEP